MIIVLQKQIQLVLDEKPMDLKILTKKIADISYESVITEWQVKGFTFVHFKTFISFFYQKERQEEMEAMIANNPCVQLLKKTFSNKNEHLVFVQRTNFMLKGSIFPKILEKVVRGT